MLVGLRKLGSVEARQEIAPGWVVRGPLRHDKAPVRERCGYRLLGREDDLPVVPARAADVTVSMGCAQGTGDLGHYDGPELISAVTSGMAEDTRAARVRSGPRENHAIRSGVSSSREGRIQ